MIGCWQPKQLLNSDISELGEDDVNVGELEPEPVCVWGGVYEVNLLRVVVSEVKVSSMHNAL